MGVVGQNIRIQTCAQTIQRENNEHVVSNSTPVFRYVFIIGMTVRGIPTVCTQYIIVYFTLKLNRHKQMTTTSSVHRT